MYKGSPRATAHQGSPRLGHWLAEIVLLVLRSALWAGSTAVGIALNMWGAAVLLLLLAPANFWAYFLLLSGAAVIGFVGGMVISFGQVLALLRWLDGAASLGSFLSTALASALALAVGTGAGWWVHTVAGDLAGGFAGLVIYGSVFGFVQRPMLDYMSNRSILWVPANAVASVLGALAVLAAFDASGGRREMLQFKYAGIAYALVVGVAFLLMTRQTRTVLARRRARQDHVAGHNSPPSSWELKGESGHPHDTRHNTDDLGHDPGVLEIHEHCVYRIYPLPEDPHTLRDAHANASGRTSDPGVDPCFTDGPDVIDATYRVIP